MTPPDLPLISAPFPLGRELTRCAEWLSDGVLVANRRLTFFSVVHRAMPFDGVWRLEPGGSRCLAEGSRLQEHVDELLREPLLPIVLHIPDHGACPGAPEAVGVVPGADQWEAVTEHGSYVFDGRIGAAAMYGQPTDWWWRLTFAFETVPTLVGGLGDDRLFFLAGIMPRELAGVS